MSNKKLFVAISPCLINQGIRAQGVRCDYDTTVKPLINMLLEENVGIYVLPCCEVPYEGLERKAGFERYQENDDFKKYCNQRANEITKELGLMERGGMKLIAIIGVSGSPTCAVENLNRWRHVKGFGIFMSAIRSFKDQWTFTEFNQYKEKETVDNIKNLIRKRISEVS